MKFESAMAGILPITRKRSRSAEEEDFLPLSKKINNLHINQWQTFEKERQVIGENGAQNWPKDVLLRDTNPSWTPMCNPPPLEKQLPPQSWPPPYAPDLTAAENPFYFDSNRLLFELYLSRVHRTTY